MLTRERAIEKLRRLLKIAKYGRQARDIAITIDDGPRTMIGLKVPIEIVEAIVREDERRMP